MIFIVEAIIKIIAFGFYNEDPESYFKNSWNIIDFIVILISIAVHLLELKFLKGLRALRVIRLSLRWKSIKTVVVSIVKSGPIIFSLTIFAFGCLSVLGLFPLKYFKGKYYLCDNMAKGLEISSKWDCMDTGGDWVPGDLHWDNILHSTYNMFIISSCEGWSFMMTAAWKSTNITLDRIPGLHE